MTAIVMLAKFGDILNVIPIAKHLHDTEGEPPLWIVHKLYEPVLRSVSYVTPLAVTSNLHRVDIALKLAKTKAQRVLNCHTFGKQWKGTREISYNLLAWQENGYGEHFHNLETFPLLLDRRDAEREATLSARFLTDERPVMLLNVGCGKSSPFSQHALFADNIRRKWAKRFKIVDLCDVNAARLYDIAGLMDRARILITVDTSALHLAAACPNLKVICLTNDIPFLASEPRYRPVFKTKYSEAMGSLPKIHETIIGLL